MSNIQNLYNQIEVKGDFLSKCAKHFKRKPQTLKNHWFSAAGFYSIPEELLDEVITYMQNYIMLQTAKEIEVI